MCQFEKIGEIGGATQRPPQILCFLCSGLEYNLSNTNPRVIFKCSKYRCKCSIYHWKGHEMCYHLMCYISDHHQCLSNRSFQKGNFLPIMLVFFVFYSPGDVFEAKVCLAKMQIGHKIILSCSGVLRGTIDFLFAIIQTYSEDKKTP